MKRDADLQHIQLLILMKHNMTLFSSLLVFTIHKLNFVYSVSGSEIRPESDS